MRCSLICWPICNMRDYFDRLTDNAKHLIDAASIATLLGSLAR